MKIWDTFMFRGELDMLSGRLETLGGLVDGHVLVESPVTHRGVPKPLHYRLNADRYLGRNVTGLVVAPPNGIGDWQREHLQRDWAWSHLDIVAEPEDWVLICDVDELPNAEVLEWLRTVEGGFAVSIDMRTTMFAVDWEVMVPLPPTCVAARAGYIKSVHGMLGGVRDGRERYQRVPGGWHCSWLGGPEAQIEKLTTGTCHTEIQSGPEGPLIMDGTRYRTGEAAGGIPVEPVDVDESWPRFIYERRCPESWFRPR